MGRGCNHRLWPRPLARLLLVFGTMLFCLEAATPAVAQCSVHPDPAATEFHFRSDSDGIGNKVRTPYLGCDWTVTCGAAPGTIAPYEMHVFVQGLEPLSTVRGIDARGRLVWSAGGLVVTRTTEWMRGAQFVSPVTVSVRGTINNNGPIDGMELNLTCIRSFNNETDASKYVEVSVVPNETQAASDEGYPFTLEARDYVPPMNMSVAQEAVGTVRYTFTCPRPGQQITFELVAGKSLRHLEDFSAYITTRTNSAPLWPIETSRSFFDQIFNQGVIASDARHANSTIEVLYRGYYNAGVNIPIVIRCSNDSYYDCSSRGLYDEALDRVIIKTRDGVRQKAMVLSDPDGSGRRQGRVGMKCHVTVECEEPDLYEPYMLSFNFHSGRVMDLWLAGADGIARGRHSIPEIYEYGHYFRGPTAGIPRWLPFPLTTLNSFGAETDRQNRRVRYGATGGLYVYMHQWRYADLSAYFGIGFKGVYRCERRARLEAALRPAQDMVATAYRERYGLKPSTPVDPWMLNDEQTPFDRQSVFTVGTLTAEEKVAFADGFYEWDPLEMYAIRVPMSCGQFSNMVVRLFNFTGWNTNQRVGKMLYPPSDDVRVVGGGRTGYYDAYLWFIRDREYLVGSPAELQWTTFRLGASSKDLSGWPNINNYRELAVEWTCTAHGRNAPPWPATARENFKAAYTDRNVSEVVWSVPSFSKNPYAKPIREEEGRVDAVSSDRDGAMDTIKTFYNLTINIECPRRLPGCSICFKDLFARLNAGTTTLSLHNADGSLLLDVFGTLPSYADTQNRFLPIRRCARDGGIVEFRGLPGSPQVDGFTLTFYPRTTFARIITFSESISRTGTHGGSSRTAHATATMSTSRSRAPTPSLTRAATRTAVATSTVSFPHTVSRTLTPSISLSATKIFIPRKKPEPPKDATAAITGTVSAATTMTAATASGAAAPPDSVLEMQGLVAASQIRCTGDSSSDDEPDDSEATLERIRAVVGPAESSLLPFTVSEELPEGYLLGSLVIAVGVFGLHCGWLRVQQVKHKSRRIGMTASRFPSATFQVWFMLHYGVSVESMRLLDPGKGVQVPLRSQIIAGVFAFFAVLPVLVAIVFLVAYMRRNSIEYRGFDSYALEVLGQRRADHLRLIKAAKADVVTAKKDRAATLGSMKARVKHLRALDDELGRIVARREQRSQPSPPRGRVPVAAGDESIGSPLLVVPQLEQPDAAGLPPTSQKVSDDGAERPTVDASYLDADTLTQHASLLAGADAGPMVHQQRVAHRELPSSVPFFHHPQHTTSDDPIMAWAGDLDLCERLRLASDPISNVISSGDGREERDVVAVAVARADTAAIDDGNNRPINDESDSGDEASATNPSIARSSERSESGADELEEQRLRVQRDRLRHAEDVHNDAVVLAERRLRAVKSDKSFPTPYLPMPWPFRPTGYWIPVSQRASWGFFFSSFRGDSRLVPILGWFLVPYVRCFLTVACIHLTAIPCPVRIIIVTTMPGVTALCTAAVRPFRSPIRSALGFLAQAVACAILVVAAVPGIEVDTRIIWLVRLMLVSGGIGIVSTVTAVSIALLESKLRRAYERVSPCSYKARQAARRQAASRKRRDAEKISAARERAGESAALLVQHILAKKRAEQNRLSSDPQEGDGEASDLLDVPLQGKGLGVPLGDDVSDAAYLPPPANPLIDPSGPAAAGNGAHDMASGDNSGNGPSSSSSPGVAPAGYSATGQRMLVLPNGRLRPL